MWACIFEIAYLVYAPMAGAVVKLVAHYNHGIRRVVFQTRFPFNIFLENAGSHTLSKHAGILIRWYVHHAEKSSTL